MANTFAVRIVSNQRQRMVGAIMGYCEREVYPSLAVPAQKALRDQVLAAVGQYHDAVLDIIKASVDDGSGVNEHALQLLEDIHRTIQRGR